LTVLGKGARYDVLKFRDGTTMDEIVTKWDTIADAIKAVRDFVVKETYIRSDKALPSYLALIPLIYYRYHYPQKFAQATGLQEYLLRS
jgi:negative regulator of replication initiation